MEEVFTMESATTSVETELSIQHLLFQRHVTRELNHLIMYTRQVSRMRLGGTLVILKLQSQPLMGGTMMTRQTLLLFLGVIKIVRQ